jgi:hypothetical protein
MARYNSLELNLAVQKVVDALLGVPEDMASDFVQEMIAYRKEQHLGKHYPELIQAFEEMMRLSHSKCGSCGIIEMKQVNHSPETFSVA